MVAMLINEIIERFSRQILVKEIGIKGQLRLTKSRVAIIGCGATGTFQAELLARLGIGYLKVIDKDVVELSNLHRTLMFTEKDVVELMPKAVACAKHIAEINSSVKVEPIVKRLTPFNAEEILSDVDLIIDGTDDFETRFIINEVAVKNSIPWIYVGVERWYATVMPIIPGKTPCLKCILPQPPQRQANICEILGVVNTAVALATSISTSIALRILLGYEVDPLIYVIDSFKNNVERIRVNKNPKCPICSLGKYEYLGKHGESIVIVCGSNQVEILPKSRIRLRLDKLKHTDKLKIIKKNPYVAKIRISGREILLFADARALILGTIEKDLAARTYNDLLGILEDQGLMKYIK